MAFAIALHGVTRFGLFAAVEAVLQNKLSHPFFPDPPELRGLCDKAMEHHRRMRERIENRERAYRERPPERGQLTNEERQRQEERMVRFSRAIGADEQSQSASFEAEMQAKYGAEALASIPDNPKRLDVPGFGRLKA